MSDTAGRGSTASDTANRDDQPRVRSVFSAVAIPGHDAPYDTAHLRVFYPAKRSGSMAERLSGEVPADPDRAPFPVVVLCPGVNVSVDAYRWLAEALAERGYATATYSWVGELFPGQHGVTPGVDLSVLTPDTYGSGPPCSAVGPVLGALAELYVGAGPLGGNLDLGRVALAGHSAGGTVALESAAPAYFPTVRAAFAYAAHSMAAEQLGWDPGTVLPLPDGVALLLLGGTDDGVIAASAVRYGEDDDGERIDPIERTFDHAIRGGRDDCYLGIVAGANHFALAHPDDPTTARGFLDAPSRVDGEDVRRHLAALIGGFLDAHLRGDAEARTHLDALVADPPRWLASFRRK